MKNRMPTSWFQHRLYQSALTLASIASLGLFAACPDRPKFDVSFPGPYLLIDRVDLSEADRSVSLVRTDLGWVIDGSPFLVDEDLSYALETAFRHRWHPTETRAIAGTADALRLTDESAVFVQVWPADGPPVRFRVGREDAAIIRPEGGSQSSPHGDSQNAPRGDYLGVAVSGDATRGPLERPARWVLPQGSDYAGLVPLTVPIAPDPLAWRARAVCGLRAEQATVLTIDGETVAERIDGEWVGEGLDAYRVEQLVRRVARLEANPTAPAPASTPRVALSISGPSGGCTVGVHGAGAEIRLSIDGVVAFEATSEHARALLNARRRLGSSERVALAPDAVLSATIASAGHRSTVEPTGVGDVWTSTDGFVAGGLSCGRFVRALTRLEAEYDAPESGPAFVLPHTRIRLHLTEGTATVELVIAPDGSVYARVDGGVPFRVVQQSERILRTHPCIQAS